MKILHIIPRFPINKNHTVVGGAANSLNNLTNQQRICGDDVNILSNFPLITPIDEQFFKNNKYLPINVKSEPISKMFGIEFTFKVALETLKLNRNFDIIHGHSGYIDYLLSGKLFAAIQKNRLVYSLYCPANFSSRVTRYPLRGKIIEKLSKSVIFIALSKNIAKSLNAFCEAKDIKIIPPSINILKYTTHFNKLELRSKYELDNTQPVILFVGNYSKTKNLEYVLQAFAKFVGLFPTAMLIITTELKKQNLSGREQYINNLIYDLKLVDHIKPFGITDNMFELMQLSDVLVAPFLDTDGPSDYFLAALEAMSVGTPVFVSPVGGMTEVIDGSNGKFIDPMQPDSFVKELECIFSNRSIGIEIGIESAKFIRQGFSPESVEKKVREVYLEILNRQDIHKNISF